MPPGSLVNVAYFLPPVIFALFCFQAKERGKYTLINICHLFQDHIFHLYWVRKMIWNSLWKTILNQWFILKIISSLKLSDLFIYSSTCSHVTFLVITTIKHLIQLNIFLFHFIELLKHRNFVFHCFNSFT